MNKEDILIEGCLISVIIVLLSIGIFIFPNLINAHNSVAISNSTTNATTENSLIFDNSTPEATAISIARLNDGANGFKYDTITSVSLTSDGKYWIVKMGAAGFDDWTVTVDAKAWMSKCSNNFGNRQNKDTWRPLDELKQITSLKFNQLDVMVVLENLVM